MLEQADVAGDIGIRDKKVALKPNLVTAMTCPAGPPPTANRWPGSLNTFRAWIWDITVMEGSWVATGPGRPFEAAGYDRVCRRYGIPFEDLQKRYMKEYDAAGMKIEAL